jgi:hypothetical protein
MAIRGTGENRLRVLLLLGAGVAAVARPCPVAAQTVEVRPVANVNFPTRVSLSDGALKVSQKVGLKFGGRMFMTFSNRFDITSAIIYSPGSATLSGGKKFQLSSASHSLAAASTARYWIRPPGRQFSWDVQTGVGMVFGGQTSYMDLLDGSTLSAMVSTALKYQIGDVISLKVQLRQRLLRLQFGDHESRASRPFNVAFAVGLPFLERLMP